MEHTHLLVYCQRGYFLRYGNYEVSLVEVQELRGLDPYLPLWQKVSTPTTLPDPV